MANLPESPAAFPAGVYQIETTDPVIGGPPNEGTGAGMSNIPHKQLADRTAWLKAAVDGLLASAFTEANSPRLLAQNGHFQFGPGGLIVQWGQMTVSASSSTISFPKAFPNACLIVAPIDMATAVDVAGVHAVSVLPGSFTKSSFKAIAKYVDADPQLATTAAGYIALGH